MATSSRAAVLTKTLTVLKKHFKPQAAIDRTVLEHLLYASCLENAAPELADQAFQQLKTLFFDWNEIRVCTVRDLAEALAVLPQAERAASCIRQVLQSVFEKTYEFDLESLHKLNLGKAVHYVEELPGSTPFSVAYLTQNAFGGHAIPLDDNSLMVLHLVKAVPEDADAKGAAGGVERAIAKNKGPEFFSLLQQFSMAFKAEPDAPKWHKVLIEICPELKATLGKPKAEVNGEVAGSKKSGKKAADKAPAEKAPEKVAPEKAPAAKSEKAAEKPAEKPAEKKSGKKSEAKSAAEPPPAPAPAKKAAAEKPPAEKPVAEKAAPKKKAAAPKRKPR